jgi:hypothetical protein
VTADYQFFIIAAAVARETDAALLRLTTEAVCQGEGSALASVVIFQDKLDYIVEEFIKIKI